MSKSLNDQLHTAAASGDTAAVLRLIKKGAKVNARGFYGWTPLINAAVSNRPETVKALLERGADASLTDDMGMTALQAASRNGHIGVVEILRGHSLKKIKLQAAAAKTESHVTGYKWPPNFQFHHAGPSWPVMIQP